MTDEKDDRIERIIDLKSHFKSLGQDSSVLEALVKAAILDPVEENRQTAVNSLNERYQGIIKRGYEVDGKLLVDVLNGNNVNTFYVCNVPEIYLKAPSEVHQFDLMPSELYEIPADRTVN